MAIYRESVRLAFDPGAFVAAMVANAEAAMTGRIEFPWTTARREATWEPHDWSDFD